MAMVPRKLLRNQKEIKKIHEEIKDDYLFAVKKSIVDFVLHEPEIDEDGPLFEWFPGNQIQDLIGENVEDEIHHRLNLPLTVVSPVHVLHNSH